MGLFSEFREFAMKGNFVDMAVGIVIGGAVSTVVGSMVNDLINPLVGFVTGGGADFSAMAMTLKEGVGEDGSDLELRWGSFITQFMNFLILAFVVFMIVRVINRAKKMFEQEKQAAGPSAEVKLLTEIRDALSKS